MLCVVGMVFVVVVVCHDPNAPPPARRRQGGQGRTRMQGAPDRTDQNSRRIAFQPVFLNQFSRNLGVNPQAFAAIPFREIVHRLAHLNSENLVQAGQFIAVRVTWSRYSCRPSTYGPAPS